QDWARTALASGVPDRVRPRPQGWCMNGHLATYFHLSRNCPYRQSSLTSYILPHIEPDGFPAGGEDFQPHIAARLSPFIVLLGQHRADQADDGVAAGEDADHVGAAPDLLVEAFLRV